MFWALLGLVIAGTATKIAGGIIQAGYSKKEREVEEERLETEARLLEHQAELYGQQIKLIAETTLERVGMMEEKAEFIREETARRTAGMADIAAERGATAIAGVAERGLAPGASYEAVRNRFARRFETAVTGEYQRGTLAAEHMIKEAGIFKKTAEMQAAGLALQQTAARAGISLAESQLGLLEYQEQWAPWGTGLGIAGSVLQGGMSFMTSGIQMGLF